MNSLKVTSFVVGDYLLVSRLLNGDTVSWEEAKEKLLSSRASNHVSNIRKIIGDFNCIQNETIETPGSHYERYKMNPKFMQQFQELKKQYEANESFMKRFNKRMEVKKYG